MENCRKRACHGSVVKISCFALCQEIGYSLCHAQGRTKKKQEIYGGNTSLYKSLALLTAFKPGCSPHVLLKKKKKKKHEDGFYKLQGRI